MNTKTNVALKTLGKEKDKNKNITFYDDSEKIVFRDKPKRYPFTAKALGERLTKVAIKIAVKNKSNKGSADYKKVDKALLHICEAIKALED